MALSLPTTPPLSAAVPASVKAALPAFTVMFVNGALDLLVAVLILIAGWTLSRWFGRWSHDVLERATHVDETLKPLLANFARYSVLAITIVAVLGQFGIQTTSLIALLGAAGLAIGLALQGTLSNVASGVMLLILRPFRVHENIAVGNAAGTVQEIGLFQTVLVTDDGVYVSVPNSALFSGTIVNNTRQKTRRINVTFDIDYRSDIPLAIKTLMEKVEQDRRVLKAPAPVVQVASLVGPAANVQVLAWTRVEDAGAVQSNLLAGARQALFAEGILPAQPLIASDPSRDTAGQPLRQRA
jgi:small conductance mechanosensitive channel